MAAATKFFLVVFLLLLCHGVTLTVTGCNIWHECLHTKAASLEVSNRKVLYGLETKKVVFKGDVHGPTSTGSDGNVVDWNLRKVPSGPDPLHHNGASPSKPRTP